MKTIFANYQVPNAKLNDEVSTEHGQIYRLIEQLHGEWMGLFVGMESLLGGRPKIVAEPA